MARAKTKRNGAHAIEAMAAALVARREREEAMRARKAARDNKPVSVDETTLVNPFARQHGSYEKFAVNGSARHALVNRGGTPIARWKSCGALDDQEIAAIEHCWKLWDRAGRQSGLVMDLNKMPGLPGGDGMAQHEALEDLHRIKGYFPDKYWSVFENVCRFDEPAGVAGSKLATNKDEHVAAARLTVKFVASVIAQNERLSY